MSEPTTIPVRTPDEPTVYEFRPPARDVAGMFTPDAAPRAGRDTADELRKEIARAICPGTYCESHSECREDADAVLALPSMRRLLDAKAAVRELADSYPLGSNVPVYRIYRALDGGAS